ncbi:hypothetical protein [Actinopolyspora erythraea]|uniref:hypothetical protein n=1 Tax=Actinopolyspora erythraea TaxID=414996 RepID=UPI001185DA4F|nr:hypothetical protein [Actinopolyspora erythraea]
MTSPDAGSGTLGMGGFLRSAADMRTAAAAGRFAADPESGRALVAVLARRRTWAVRQFNTMYRLAQEPPLGSSPGANVFKPFFASIANHPNEGISPQWEKFIQVIDETIRAVNESMKNYHDIDVEQAGRLNSTSGYSHET